VTATNRPGTGTKVPPGLGLGCWEFADIGSGPPDDRNSGEIIAAAYAKGIIHLDTAQDYGKGHSEAVVGASIKAFPNNVFIASKTHATGRSETVRAVEESIARIGRDYIDLYYIHWPKTGFDLRPMMEGLEELRSNGRIRFIGVSNFGVEAMRQVGEVGRIDAHQLCYNLLWRYPERDVIPYCVENGIELVTYSSIAQGLLSDKKRGPDAFAPGDARRNTIYYREDVWPRLREVVEAMQGVAAGCSMPLSSLAIRWVIGRSWVTSALVAARTGQQLENNADAAAGILDPKVESQLSALSDEAMRRIPDVGNIFLFYP